jgi:hypothetical protein
VFDEYCGSQRILVIPKLGSKIPKMGTKKRKPNSHAPVSSGVADALFTKVQQRVLAVLFVNHSRSFYANDTAAANRKPNFVRANRN